MNNTVTAILNRSLAGVEEDLVFAYGRLRNTELDLEMCKTIIANLLIEKSEIESTLDPK